MYLKVHSKGNQWFRDDNGTLVGQTADTYYNTYHSFKPLIIKLLDGSYVRPIYGRIVPNSDKFVPLCEGVNTKLCTGPFCKGFSNDPYICPKYKAGPTDGYYILVD